MILVVEEVWSTDFRQVSCQIQTKPDKGRYSKRINATSRDSFARERAFDHLYEAGRRADISGDLINDRSFLVQDNSRWQSRHVIFGGEPISFAVIIGVQLEEDDFAAQ